MVITTDIILRGKTWDNIITALAPIFTVRTNYSIYLLCVSIGVMYDQRIEKFEDELLDGEEMPEKTVPRNVIVNAEKESGGKLEYMFQAAILSTKSQAFNEEYRLELAFADEKDDSEESKDCKFNKLAFLTQFANFGATKLEELLGETVVESMENIKNFLSSTVEGNNFDIDAIPDDIWLDDV